MKVRFDVSKLRIGTCRIGARHNALSPGMRIVRGDAKSVTQWHVHADVPNICQTAVAATRPAGIAECSWLESASAAIPEVLRTSQAQRVQLAAHHQGMRQTEYRGSVKILVVHHIVERETGIGTRRGQHVKESRMPSTDGMEIADAMGIARSKPGIYKVHDRLPAEFPDESFCTMGLHAPTAVLHGSPQEEVELTTILRLENVNVVGAVSSDANVIFVGRACGDWTVIGLEDRSSFV